MTDTQLSLNREEQDFLTGLLESELKETRVEEHRTRKPSYREHIVRTEEILESLLNKLERAKIGV